MAHNARVGGRVTPVAPPMRTMVQICLGRAGPQDLPASGALLAAALLLHAAADALSVRDLLPWAEALKTGLVHTLLLAALTHVALLLRRLEHRARQTIAAVAGCGALISFLVWGASVLLAETLPPWLVLAPFLLWYLGVMGHILRQAMAVPFAAGVALGFAFFILSSAVTGALIRLPLALG